MSYEDAITAAVAMIERKFLCEVCTIGKREMGMILLDVHDVLTSAISPDWWERDVDAEAEQMQRILEAL